MVDAEKSRTSPLSSDCIHIYTLKLIGNLFAIVTTEQKRRNSYGGVWWPICKRLVLA